MTIILLNAYLYLDVIIHYGVKIFHTYGLMSLWRLSLVHFIDEDKSYTNDVNTLIPMPLDTSFTKTKILYIICIG